jgi:hypothetical protein
MRAGVLVAGVVPVLAGLEAAVDEEAAAVNPGDVELADHVDQLQHPGHLLGRHRRVPG